MNKTSWKQGINSLNKFFKYFLHLYLGQYPLPILMLDQYYSLKLSTQNMQSQRLYSLIILPLIVLGLMLASIPYGFAAEVTVFGPQTYLRQSGATVPEVHSFSVSAPQATYILNVYNGGLEDDTVVGDLVSSSNITINGLTVISANSFNQNVDFISIPVTLLGSNEIAVELRGKPGGAITLEIVGTVNAPPVAHAGPDQTVFIITTVQLDGSGSTDVEGSLLNYNWSFTTLPIASIAELSDPFAVMPTFDIDLPGTYVLQLQVDDGELGSAPDTVEITTANSPPVADAGLDQTVFAQTTVQLDASGSSDVDGDPLNYQWILLNQPTNSQATLANANTILPQFFADLPGEYQVQLVVNDGQQNSTADIIVIQTENSRPVANAGLDLMAFVNEIVTLDGDDSFDVDNDNLSFEWSLTSIPLGSTAFIQNVATSLTEFEPDLPGLYVAQLIVRDDISSSDPDTAKITVEVQVINEPPVITSTPIASVTVGNTYLYDVDADDPNGDILSYSLSAFAPGMAIDNSSGLISWVPTTAGIYSVIVIVDDGKGGSTSQSYTLTVIQPNEPPVISSIPVIEAIIDVDYSYQTIATDHENDSLTYLLTTAPLGMQINSSSGLISWVPAVAGIAPVTIRVQDSAGLFSEQQYSININYPDTNQPPLWQSIGDRTVPLGTQLTVQLAAINPEGTALTYAIAPLPLPEGAFLDARSGLFTFKPTLDQVGQHTLTFIAKDGRFSSHQIVTLTVPAPDITAPTEFTGRILDANLLAQGIEQPVIGATVTFLGTAVQAVSDVNGTFSLSGLPAGNQVFRIDAATAQPAADGSGYASFGEAINLIANVTNTENRPFSLPRLAMDSLTTVNPALETVVQNTDLGITLTVPPNTAFNEDGSVFTGELSISEVPRGFAPAALPAFLDPGLLITIQPAGVSFITPVPIIFPNIDNLSADSLVDIWSLDPGIGAFAVVGVGQVSSDGQRIETISGGIRRADWHTLAPRQLVTPQPGVPALSDSDNPPADCPAASKCIGSTVNLNNGRMVTNFTLPVYRSLETNRPLTFIYQTSRAHSKPVIPFNLGIQDGGPTIPNLTSYSLTVGGFKQGQETFVSGEGLEAGETTRISVSFDGTELNTGQYAYELMVTSYFDNSSIGTVFTGMVPVENAETSSFGAGWLLEELYRLAFNLDNSVTLVSPDGHMITYRPNGTPDQFNSPARNYAVFTRNPDGSYTHLEKDGAQMHFADNGLLSAHEDRNHNITQYQYNSEAQLKTIIDPVGLITTLTYTNGVLESITDPANRSTDFIHDAFGNMTKVTFPDQTFEEFEYQNPQDHLITAHFDERRNRNTYHYDTFGRLTQATLPDGTVRSAANQSSKGLIDVDSGIGTETNPAPIVNVDQVDGDYIDGRGNSSSKLLDEHGFPLLVIDELGRVTTHIRDNDSNPIQTTRPIGSVVTRTFDDFGNALTVTEEFNGATSIYSYDQFSLLTSVTNPNAHTTRINRDPANGNPLTIINHLDHTTTLEYDSRGLITQVTQPNGLVINYTYNIQGLMETQTEIPPAGSPGNTRHWSYSYFPTGLLQTVNTPDGITLNYHYDARSYLTNVTDNLNQSINYIYDEHKNVIKVETSSADSSIALLIDHIYDNRNRLIESKAPHVDSEESVTQRLLDENSNLIGLTDPNGNPDSNSYDAFNRLETNTHRESGVAEYAYDQQDRIISVTASNGVDTVYTYDSIGRKIRAFSPNRGNIRYAYDLANNITSIRDGRLITVDMTYDELERVKTKTYPNSLVGKNENVTYSYDSCPFGLGHLCAQNDESGEYDYEYDAFGNLTQSLFTETQGISYTTAYVFDDGNHVIQTTYPSGLVVEYARDGVRRVEAINTILNGTPQNIISGIQYRSDNQMLSCDYGNGLNDTRNYDLQGRLLNQKLTDEAENIIDERMYTYDKNSNILNIDTLLEDNAYLYDKLDRITTDTINSEPPINYSYDLNNNRLSRQLEDLSRVETISYNGLLSDRIQTLDTIQVGSVEIEPLSRDMVYNDAGRLFQLIQDNALKAEYFYNDQGQRTRKVVHNPDLTTTTTIFHYDQVGYLISETNEQGVLIKDYIWQENMHPVAQIDNTQGSEQVLYLYTDHLMTNRLATSQNQAVVWRWEGDAFGNTAAQELSGFSVNLRFPGQYFDSETGLHYNYYRYYDPSTGRYITSDPIGLQGGLNTYAYVDNNPLNFIDPLGLSPKPGLGSGVESHNGGKQHVHWGNKSNLRQNAVNKDGSIRHGKKPTKGIKKLINRKFGWNLKAPIFLCPLCSVLDEIPKQTPWWEDPDFCEI